MPELLSKLLKLAPDKILDVSKLDNNGIGARTINRPKTEKSSKKIVPGIPLASDNFPSYELAIKMLGSNYLSYVEIYRNLYPHNTISNHRIEATVKPSLKGKLYEDQIRNKLLQLKYQGNPINCETNTAGNNHGVDINFYIADTKYGIECKNKGSFEGGGKAFKLIDGKLVIPSEDLLFYDLLKDHIPFAGKIPCFKLFPGDKSKLLETWLAEKDQFKNYYLEIADSSIIAKYYQNKGANYIQVEDLGLYHTGSDPLNLEVPLFECKIKIRIRCKQHRSDPLPSSIQASLTFIRKSITKSPFDLMGNLPKLLN